MRSMSWFGLFLFCACVLCGPAAGQQVQTIAVLDLETKGLDESAGKILSDKLREDLLATGRFLVMERSEMVDIMKEHGLQQSGACSDDGCLSNMGKMLGVEKMVAGSMGKLGKRTLISVRLFDINTGKIEKTVSQSNKLAVDDLPKMLTVAARKLAGMDVAADEADLAKLEQSTALQEKSDEEMEFKKKKEIAEASSGSGKSFKTITIIATTSLVVVGGVTGLVIWAMSKKEEPKPAAAETPAPALPLPPVPPSASLSGASLNGGN